MKAINDTLVKVIHKGTDGVVEEVKRYRSYNVTLLDYHSRFTGKKAVRRAREIMRKSNQEAYDLLSYNCEHFVTEVRTGEKQSSQVRGAVSSRLGAAVGAVVGAGIGSLIPIVGIPVGAGVGALVGGWAGGST